MITQADPVKEAILAALADDHASASIQQLFSQLGHQYRRSDVSAALWALIREDRVLLTDDRHVRESRPHQVSAPIHMQVG